MTKTFRPSIIVLSILISLALLGSVGFYFITMINNPSNSPDIFAMNLDLFSAFSDFSNFIRAIGVYGLSGLWLVISIVWLIVDIRRRKAIVALLVPLYLIATYLTALFFVHIYNYLTNGHYPDMNKLKGVIIIGGLAGVGVIFSLVTFVVDLITGKRVKDEEKPEETAPEAEEEAKPVYEEIKTEEDTPAPAKEEVEPAIVPPTEEQLEFERREEEASSDMEDEPKEKKPKKPANKKPTEKKPTASKKPTETKPAKKPASKKPSKEEEEDDDSDNPRVYHVSRRPELNKWQVKMAGSDKAIKLFNTQKEAIDYAEQLAESQGGSVRVHGVNGKIRKHRS